MMVDAGVALIAVGATESGLMRSRAAVSGYWEWKNGCWSAGTCGSPPNREWVPRLPPRVPGVSGIRCVV